MVFKGRVVINKHDEGGNYFLFFIEEDLNRITYHFMLLIH
jgi:hypothetical protein